jgi:glycine oxidase
MNSVSAEATSDTLIIGDGLIGLSTALELGRAGLVCTVVGITLNGAASAAAAGLLVPSIGDLSDEERAFFFWGLDQYPAFVSSLCEFDPELRLIDGMIERGANGDSLLERDGAVDNVRLLNAVRAAVRACTSVSMKHALVALIERHGDLVAAVTTEGERLFARRIVVAAGAWAGSIGGLPRALPVRPLKGQMIALGASPLRQSMMGDDVYLVPRGAETLVGATVEEKGFDTTVTPDAVASLQAGAIRLCPELEGAPITRSWAGIRPATPDGLPILGPDPSLPQLIYACGHSKNGILLAPGTAVAVKAWVRGEPTPPGVEQFSIAIFDNR